MSDFFQSSIITTVPNQRDVANRRLIISSDPIENVSGLPVECLLLQNVEHEKSNGNDMTSTLNFFAT